VDKREAKEIILRRMTELEALPFGQLLQFQKSPSTEDFLGPSGETYQLEIFAVWERKKNRTLRVVVAIDDGGWRSFAPMSVGFPITQKDDPVECPVFLAEVEGRDIGICASKVEPSRERALSHQNAIDRTALTRRRT
jgi:hypothetical protein